ncbi:MAG: hypothetical protein ACO3I0_05145 [Limisphaerales bacterium]
MKAIGLQRASLKLPALGLLVAGASSAFAQITYYDVSTPGTIANVNGGQIFTSAGSGSTGTGTFGGFLRLGGSGSVNVGISSDSSGSALNLMADVLAPQTAALTSATLTAAPATTIGGTSYYAFYFDLNEPQTLNRQYISLDSLIIYSSSVGPTVWATSLADFTSSGNSGAPNNFQGANPTVRWSLDDLGSDKYTVTNDRSVLIDTSVIGGGSGTGDMYALVPTAAFSGLGSSDYLYFYASFGGAGVVGSIDYSSQGGFGEVGLVTSGLTFTSLPSTIISPSVVPETVPGSALGIGLAAAGWLRSRRRSRVVSDSV